MRKKIFVFLLTFSLSLVLIPTKVWAAKKFIPKKSTAYKSSINSSLPAVVRYRSDKFGILLSFTNFTGINSVSYLFTYTTSGISQGAGGSITANNNPTLERQLLFGTCSTSVCTYHYNLSNAKLKLTAKYSDGTTKTKIFRIKTYL